MQRQVFEVTGRIDEIDANEGDTVEFDPSNREEPLIVVRGFGWRAVAKVTGHPNLVFRESHPVVAHVPDVLSPCALPKLLVLRGGAS